MVTRVYRSPEGIEDCDKALCFTCDGVCEIPADGKTEWGVVDHLDCSHCETLIWCNMEMGDEDGDEHACRHMDWCRFCVAAFGCDLCDAERRESMGDMYDTEPPF